ncbi:ABC transporter ATP-binding protein [Paenibacillus albiflavus]|uniref:ABC transporter ATP-binding protein n=1 Tax=Paenibacillus albiflavus TaxID=2545760 RepID=A0A4R4EJN7_9BACL|nr:ABC transporter ATP-binding protein [Paenibacillus albiflavus]TCZ79480.1 ABC transporter ATP-binding protein [Paenibacillus albiflavus]
MSVQDRIQLVGVNRLFNKTQVLHDVSFTVPPAQIYGLLGPSGSGKTTIVKLIAGIDQATSGDVFVLGNRMPKLSVLSNIGYMAQSDALYHELTAEDNLIFFASLFGLKSAHRKQRIKEVMELVDLSSHLHKRVSLFSGGMKRRLSLAIALLHEPSILILDEPTVGIDPLLRQSIWSKLEGLSKQGTTILITTHVMDEAAKCDRLGMIRNGRLIAEGTPQQLQEQTGADSLEGVFIHYGGADL